jgi:hypothetical protein
LAKLLAETGGQQAVFGAHADLGAQGVRMSSVASRMASSDA